MIDTIGWVATALFALSYFLKTPARLRWVQAGAASLWIVYGVALRAMPVVAANTAVAGLALLSLRRRQEPSDKVPQPPPTPSTS